MLWFADNQGGTVDEHDGDVVRPIAVIVHTPLPANSLTFEALDIQGNFGPFFIVAQIGPDPIQDVAIFVQCQQVLQISVRS